MAESTGWVYWSLKGGGGGKTSLRKLGLKMFLKNQNTETSSLAPASTWRTS